MKRIAVAALTAALAAMAQAPPKQKAADPVIKCKGPDGRACTARQVQALSDAVFAGKRQHEALALFRSLTLNSASGALKCEQTDGSACTTPQLDAVKEIAAGQQLFLNYNVPK